MTAWHCANCDLPRSRHVRRTGASSVCDECRESLARRGLAWCGGCGAARPGVEKARCRECRAARRAAYYAAHAAEERAAALARYRRDPQTHIARVAAWRRTDAGRRSGAATKLRWRHRRLPHVRALEQANAVRYRQRHRARLAERARQYRVRVKLRILRGEASTRRGHPR